MSNRLALSGMLAVLALILCPAAGAQSAPDFPPGVFNDGGDYKLADFKGKVLVLFFYERDCPRCRGTVPERNAIVQKYQGKPVKFIAIAAGDTPQQAISYVNSTRLAMPVFADTLSLMEKRYGTKISLQNIWQFRVIGPDGSIVAHSMDEAAIDSALASAKWDYKDKGFDPRLGAAVEMFEWKQFEAGMQLLRPHLRSSNKPLAESARKLLDAVKEDHGNKWREQAEKLAAEEKTAHAYELYARMSAVFRGDELGKLADEQLKKLKGHKAVKTELEAQRAYNQLLNGMSRARAEDVGEIKAFAESIVKKYPNTPTADRADALAKSI
jgi:thiol-disulfide isomerase/thioredoxin